ncbi:VOC family protein [Halobacillus kuroshimensis]|uniref:VOC family protein n=1 Tax=Halobacillus kuroshimensis TaxID=302481 RepID=A0ABS3DRJ8_9BACI|nr:VOC family protein [Halobacillus kuroshimensis]MBN8233959.1 VOC family protein [Halobacillus kuroshimensis]
MKHRIHTCFIHLVYFDRTKEWYKRVLPFDIQEEGDGYLTFDLEGTGLVLLQAQTDSIRPLPYAPFFLETENIEETYRELKAKGVKVDDVESFGGSIYGCHFYDPEGNQLLTCSVE